MEDQGKLKGNIFDIQGLSIHDGPGCRTVIFLKGCPLKCQWCSNPEGIMPQIEVLYNRDKCISDGNCIAACQPEAIHINSDGELVIDRQKCTKCVNQSCSEVCLTGALKPSSRWLTLDEVDRIIQRDRQFWGSSGGLTLSGGEPLFQFHFAYELLKKAYESYVHTAIETCGFTTWRNYEKVMPFLDWIFFDLKHLNSKKHKEKTGTENKIILNNARKLARQFKGRMIFRSPVIPGFNDDKESINQIAQFISQTQRREINILPYHEFGISKYHLLGLDPPEIRTFKMNDSKKLNKMATQLEGYGIKTYVGSETEF
jgi:pyruvate formate lyase activating enzyme